MANEDIPTLQGYIQNEMELVGGIQNEMELIATVQLNSVGGTGEDGESAYEIAVDNGFVGTISQWLASLIGADGVDGVDGVDGAIGPQGVQGPQGLQGTQGPIGPTGNNGADGATGLQGPAGTNGAPGSTGPSGPNTVSTSTSTNITGILKGNGSLVQQAVADTDYLTPGTALTSYEPKNTNIQSHIANNSNPHGVTKSQVGLGNVDNTSDVNKPVSSAQSLADTAVQNYSIQRANHTGTQLSSTISDFTSASKTAVVDNSITSGVVDKAPSEDSVFNALALKAPLSSAPNSIRGNNTGATANAIDLTATQATEMLNEFTGDGGYSGANGVKGLVKAPLAGDSTLSKVLKADGTWSANFPETSVQEATRSVSTWVVRNATQPNQWIDVVYAPDLRLFVSVASSGTNRVMYSVDGITWVSASATSASQWTSITYSPELKLLCAVAYDGSVMTSPDAITWTAQTAAQLNTWYRVVWAPSIGLFAAVSLSGTNRVMTSPDGVTWTAQTSPIDQWYSITWSPELNLFVAVSGSGSTMSSPDGVTWTSNATGIATNWYDIQWSPQLGIFVVVGITGAVRVMTSKDGVNWTAQTSPGAAWRRITWAPYLGRFIAVSSGGTIMTSPDGVGWNSRTSPQANQWYGIAWSFDYKICVITGITGTNRVLNSTYTGGFQTGGLAGPSGLTGPIGPTGANGAANPNGEIPSATATQSTQQTTASASFVDVPGLSTTITNTTASKIAASFSGIVACTVTTAVGEFRVVIDSQNGTAMIINLQNTTEKKGISANLLSTQLAAGTYTVKVQYRETSGLGTLALNQGTLVAQSLQASAPFTIDQACEYQDDFIQSAVTGNLGWTSAVTGTGAANTKVNTAQSSNNVGIVQHSTGTTATGLAAIALGGITHFFGGGVATQEMLIQLPILSTALQEYRVRVGMGDIATSADQIDGVYFEYDRAINGTNWRMKTANNSVRTNTDSGVAVVAGVWIKLKMIINSSGTNVDYYINGTLAGSVTTNIPTTVARVSSPLLLIAKTVGTTASTLLTDYYKFSQIFTTPR